APSNDHTAGPQVIGPPKNSASAPANASAAPIMLTIATTHCALFGWGPPPFGCGHSRGVRATVCWPPISESYTLMGASFCVGTVALPDPAGVTYWPYPFRGNEIVTPVAGLKANPCRTAAFDIVHNWPPPSAQTVSCVQ